MHILGHRISLRHMKAHDLELFTYWLQEDTDWKRWDAPYYPLPPKSETDTMIAELRQQIQRNDWPAPPIFLAIAHRETDQFLGRVSWNWVSKETHWPEVGIVLYDPQHRGQGLGYEALGLWSDYLFQQFSQFVRLDLRTWSGNTGMIRLAQKLGYIEEARFLKARVVDGQHHDGLGYGVLREEWQANYPDGFKL